MKKLLFFTILSLLSTISFAQKLIAVQESTDSVKFFSTLYQAVVNAAPNSTIYLPGGVFTLSVGLDKTLHFVGAGVHPDSTVVTRKTWISGILRIREGADGSSFEGVEMIEQTWFYGVSNIHLKRCFFQKGIYFHDSGNINFLLEECYLSSISRHASPINLTAVKCIIDDIQSVGISNKFEDCIISQVQDNLKEIEFEECIFNTGIGDKTSDCSFANCIFASTPPDDGNFVLNSIEASGDIFVEISQDIFHNNYHLNPDNSTISAAFDGTTELIGLYAHPVPFKDNWIPRNPHISEKAIGVETLPDGTLPVQVKVVGQEK